MKTEPDTMRFRLCSLLKYSGGRGKLRFLRTGMFFQNIPVLRSAYFPKKLFSFFSKTLDLQVRFALPPMPHRNVFSKHSGVTVGLFSEKALQLFLQNVRPSGSLRSPYDAAPKCPFKTFRCSGRLIFRKSSSAFSSKRSTSRFASLSLRWAGEASLPLHPSLLPPKNANGRAGGKRTRLGRIRNRARRRRRRYAAAQRTPARRSRARGLPVRGSQGQDGRPRGGPGEPQRPRFAPPRERRGKPTSGKTNTQTPHRKGSVFGAGSGYYLCQK